MTLGCWLWVDALDAARTLAWNPSIIEMFWLPGNRDVCVSLRLYSMIPIAFIDKGLSFARDEHHDAAYVAAGIFGLR